MSDNVMWRATFQESFQAPIEQLDLSPEECSKYRQRGITTVGGAVRELLEMLEGGTDAMLVIRNFSEKSLDKIVEMLKEMGHLAQDRQIGKPKPSP